jgi:hypothetical protein
MKKRRRSLGRPLLHARALCDHGAPRRSPQKHRVARRVVDRGRVSTGSYWLLAGSTAGVPAGRAIRGPDLSRSASLNRHKICRPGYKNGLKKGGWAGLKALCQRMGRNAPCRGMYLELRPRPMSREHARPQPPAATSRRYGGGAGESTPVPVGVTGHRTQRPRGQVGPPGPHPAQPSSSLDPGGERWPIPLPLAPLIAQLVLERLAFAVRLQSGRPR